MFKYAYVINNVVAGLQSSTNEIIHNDLIAVAEFPMINDIYSPTDGTWEAPTIIPASDVPITIISVAAMRARLTVSEREAIRNTTDIFVRDIWDDLNSRLYVDLGDVLVVQGIAYITNYLTSVPDVFDNNVMTVTDLATRSTALLIDGTQTEKYNGVL